MSVVITKPFLGSGLSMPLRESPTGDLVYSVGSDQIKESLSSILGTRPGERRMLPGYGSALHKLMFEDFDDPVTQSLANVYSITAVRTWEPRVTPINTQIFQASMGDWSGFALQLNYVEIATNTPNNIVFPFNRG